MKMRQFISAALLAGILTLLLAGCGPRKIGYGVLLWSPDEEKLPTGAFVNIYQESRINNTYTVGRPGQSEEVDLPHWRIKAFAREEEAQDYAGEYQEFTQSFAIAGKQGLPLREESSPTAERVYKLRDGQNIKVLSRSSQEVTLGSLKGYWYKVLTADGVIGYCFDYYLTIYNMNDDQRVFVEEEEEMSPQLTNFLNNTWHPEEFLNMLTKNTIDLTKFRAQYSLSVDHETKTIRLSLPDHTVVENYTDISNIGYKRYFFEGSSFQITITSNDFVSAEYSYDGQQYAMGFVLFARPVEEYIAAERNRRYRLFQEFLKRGTLLDSKIYGSISLDTSQNFTWKPLTSLKEREVLSAGTPDGAGSGKMVFSHFLTPQLKQSHDGAVTFAFTGLKPYQEATFLYSLTNQGVQFIYVPPANIEEMMVLRETFYVPLVMFFSFSEALSEESFSEEVKPEEAQAPGSTQDPEAS